MLVLLPPPAPPATDSTLVPGLVLPWIDGLPQPGDAGIPADRVGPPPAPDSAAARADLDAIRAAQALHSPAATAWASKMDVDGLRTIWSDLIDRSLAPADARRGQELLTQVLTAKSTASRALKATYGRPRPFVLDPSLEVPIRRPIGDPSYPSGHAAGAYAAARLISRLAPTATAEAYALARQVAVSRVYGGVHFPSDVRMGAYLGIAVADEVLRTTHPPVSP